MKLEKKIVCVENISAWRTSVTAAASRRMVAPVTPFNKGDIAVLSQGNIITKNNRKYHISDKDLRNHFRYIRREVPIGEFKSGDRLVVISNTAGLMMGNIYNFKDIMDNKFLSFYKLGAHYSLGCFALIIEDKAVTPLESENNKETDYSNYYDNPFGWKVSPKPLPVDKYAALDAEIANSIKSSSAYATINSI